MKTLLALHPDFMVYHIRSRAPCQQAHGLTQGLAFPLTSHSASSSTLPAPVSTPSKGPFHLQSTTVLQSAAQYLSAPGNGPARQVRSAARCHPLGSTPTRGEPWQHQAGPARHGPQPLGVQMPQERCAGPRPAAPTAPQLLCIPGMVVNCSPSLCGRVTTTSAIGLLPPLRLR